MGVVHVKFFNLVTGPLFLSGRGVVSLSISSSL